MTKRRFRFQISLRIILLSVAITSLGIWRFTPEIRAALIRLTARVSDVPFTSTSTTAGPGIWPSFQAMHDWYEKEFIESEYGFGLGRVAHFDDPFNRCIEVNGRLYRPLRLELVSFQDRETPLAFVNRRGNPVKKHYKEAETRSLSKFEQYALDKLRAGRDFIYNGDAEHPQFLGAIRARTKCLSCHDGKPGDLLGSFAYEVEPVVRFQPVPRGEIQ